LADFWGNNNEILSGKFFPHLVSSHSAWYHLYPWGGKKVQVS
jgi:hypothetical protein